MWRIVPAAEQDIDALTELWEASVRATHTFLDDSDITGLRTLIRTEYLQAVELHKMVAEEGILGFLGVAADMAEMLFVAPQAIGRGVGGQLLRYGIKHLGVRRVDVNEQNPQALGFYQHHGFRVVARSELDAAGRPFPILHMALTELAATVS